MPNPMNGITPHNDPTGSPTGSAEAPAKDRYNALCREREPFLQRARDAARLTIPTLVPPAGHTGSTRFPTPYQSLGARGVNNLASKLMLALFPPNEPFMRLMVEVYKLTAEQGSDPDLELLTEIEAGLSKVERAIMRNFETRAERVEAYNALRHLLVAGNALFYEGDEKPRVFPLSRYVVNRDPDGNPLEILTKELVDPRALPESVRETVASILRQPTHTGTGQGDEKTAELYTYVERQDDHWTVYQECEGQRIQESEGTYPIDACPWIPLRFNKLDGEPYGRGYIEEYQGDLQSLEILQKAIVQGSAAAAKVLILVKPNSSTRVRVIAEAPNGAVREGNGEDVTVLQMDKYADFRTAKELAAELKNDLGLSFLMFNSARRQGERVTSQEVRATINELEQSLGGPYSILSVEFQKPIAQWHLWHMGRNNQLPKLPKKYVKPAIITGVEAIGRGQDLAKLDAFLDGVAERFGPEVVAQYVKAPVYFARRGTALGVDTSDLLRTEEEVMAQKQQQQQAQMAEQAVKSLGPNAVKAAAEQAQQTPQE